jgi:hypothetical protein
MLKKIFVSVATVLLFVTVCFAQDLITGHWAGRIMDAFDLAYDFKADGTKLTGTVLGSDGEPSPISNGVIKGDSIFFKMPVQSGDLVDVKGKVKGGVLSIAFTASGYDITCDLKKSTK